MTPTSPQHAMLEVADAASVAALPQPFAALYAYWDERRSGAEMPRRQDIDPVDLKQWLGSLLMLTVLDGGQDFRYDVFGVNLVETLRYDLTRRTVLECADVLLPQVLVEYRKVHACRKPIFVSRGSPFARDYLRMDKLILPLADDEGNVSRILAALFRVPGAPGQAG